jgi:hypothetical protein
MHVNGSKFEEDISAGNLKKLPGLAKIYLLKAGGQAVILYTDVQHVYFYIHTIKEANHN